MSDQVLGIIIPGMSLIFAAAALLVWLRDKRSHYLLGFVVAPIAIGVSLTLNHYVLGWGSVSMHAIAQFFSGSGTVALAWAACARVGKKAPLALWGAGLALMLAINALSLQQGNFTVNLYLLNAYCGIVMAMAAQLMAASGSKDVVDRAIIWTFGITALQFFLRPVAVMMMVENLTAASYRDSAGHAILIVTAALFTLMLAGVILAAVISDQIASLKSSSQIDALTGLRLRRPFEEGAMDMLERSSKEGRDVAMIVGDIDHFKQVNDLWGHQAGDNAIAAFGSLIGSIVRSEDICGRIGGEEFCIMVWNCNLDDASNMADRVRRAFAAMRHDGISENVSITASFGVACWREGEGYGKLFARADAALYKAKDAGRNCVKTEGARRGAGRRNADEAADTGQASMRAVG